MDNQLTCALNGKTYLQFQVPMMPAESKQIMKMIEEHHGIIQGVNHVVKGGFWRSDVVIANVLIPESHVLRFAQRSNEKGK